MHGNHNPDKIRLTPPDPVGKAHSPSPRRGLYILILVFLVINAATAGFWIMKVRQPENPAPAQPAETPVVDSTAPQAQPPVEGSPSLKTEAQDQLKSWLEMAAEAEANLTGTWAETEYEQAHTAAAQGEKAYAGKRYQQAMEYFAQAGDILNRLRSQKQERLDAILLQGETALHAGRGQEAADAFNRVLAVEPDRVQALDGLKRAAVAEQVYHLLEEAKQLNDKGRPASALPRIRQAAELDEQHPDIAPLLAAVENALAQKAFHEAMSEFYTAMEHERFERAEKALARARAAGTDGSAVADASAQLKAKEKAALIRGLEKRFRQHKQQEEWQAAAETLEKALQAEPHTGFAVQNREETGKRLRLDRKLNSILAHPERLQENAPYANAVALLEYARAVVSPGPRLQQQQQQLARLLSLARKKVTVQLYSDNQSEITMYKVGRLGVFHSKELQLNPGRYTVIGRRAGFRNVRKTLDIPFTENASSTMTIQCEERI